MKKFFKRVCLIILLFVIIYTIYVHTLYDYHFYSSLIETEIPIFAKMEEIDTHGGFHGDGEALAKVYFSDKQEEEFVKQIKQNSHWSKLPMNELLQHCIRYNIVDDASEPVIENGYCFFVDRHDESIDKYNYNELLGRYSSNYSIAVFDMDNNVLYIYSIDT